MLNNVGCFSKWGSKTLSFIICLFTTPALAGAWVQDNNHGLILNQLTYFSSSNYLDRGGHSHSQPTYNKLEYQPYAEYGLSKTTTIGGTFLLQRDWQSNADNTGIADPEIFLRGQIHRDATQVISLQPLVKLPSFFTHDSRTPRGGSHSTDAELSILYGRNFNILSANDYADARIAYRARSHGLHGQTKADLAIGLSPATNWQIIPAIRYTHADSLDTGTFAEDGEQDYDLLKAELTVAYHLDDARWIQATIFDHVAGRQTGEGQGVTIGYAAAF